MPAGPRHLLLIRHGESVWNAEGRWQGQADPPLSTQGEAQAAEAAERLAGRDVSGVIASDLLRARRTADIIAGAAALGEVRLDPDLREIDVGDWTGLTRAEIEARWPGELAAWSEGRSESPLGGESRAHLAARARRALARAAATAPAGARLLVVTHGALIRNLDRVLGVPPQPVANLAGRWYAVDVETDGAGDGTIAIDAGGPVSLADPEDRTLSPFP